MFTTGLLRFHLRRRSGADASLCIFLLGCFYGRWTRNSRTMRILNALDPCHRTLYHILGYSLSSRAFCRSGEIPSPVDESTTYETHPQQFYTNSYAVESTLSGGNWMVPLFHLMSASMWLSAHPSQSSIAHVYMQNHAACSTPSRSPVARPRSLAR